MVAMVSTPKGDRCKMQLLLGAWSTAYSYCLSTLQARSRKRVQLRMYQKFTRSKTSREEQKLRQMDISTAIPPASAAVAGRRRRA
jgi:hypothetical protein